MHTHMKIIILMSLSVIISSCSLIEEKDFGSQPQRLEKLSAENRVIAEDLMQFIKESDQKYFKWSGCINNPNVNQQSFDCSDNRRKKKVTMGTVLFHRCSSENSSGWNATRNFSAANI